MIKINRHSYLKFKNQCGIFIPAYCAVLPVLILVVLLFGYDVIKVKLGSRQMRRLADEVCDEVSRQAPLQRQAFFSFKKKIDQNGFPDSNNPYLTVVQLTTASLVIPTSSSRIGEPFPLNGIPAGLHARFKENYLEFCEARDQVINCDLNRASIRFYWNSAASGLTKYLPQSNGWSTINNKDGAGATAGCILEGSVPTWLSGNKKITTVSVFHNYKAGRSGFYGGGSTANDNNRPSVTIAVAPYLPVSVENPLFRFHFSSNVTGDMDENFSTRFLSDYSPLHIYSTSYNSEPSADSFFQVSQINEEKGAHPLSSISRSFGDRSFLYPPPPDISGGPDCRNLDCDDRNLPTAPGADEPTEPFTERDQLLAECMNPPVLFRNIILSTLVELLSRDGQLRDGTEILLANPQNRNICVGGVCSATGPLSLPPLHRPPTVIVPFGSDLLAKNYFLPFITFFAPQGTAETPQQFRVGYGTAVAAIPEVSSGETRPATSSEPIKVRENITKALGYPEEPYFVPFGDISDSVEDEAIKREQSLIAGQLRNCLHLYKGSKGLKRFNLARLDPYVIFNPEFEESSTSAYNYSGFQQNSEPMSPLFPGEIDTSQDAWDFVKSDKLNLDDQKLNAAELVSVLGSAQLNPGLKYPLLPNVDTFPSNATIGPYDLRGDILAVIRYWLKKSTESSRPAWPSNDSQPIAFPSIPELSNKTNAANTSTNPPKNNQANLVLFLHRRLDIGEASEIKALLRNPPTDEDKFRRIIVIYIPTNPTDDSPAALDLIKESFMIPEDSTLETAEYDNVLLYFSPRNQTAYPEDTFPRYIPPSGATNEWVPYRRYYFDRLFAAGCVGAFNDNINVYEPDECPSGSLSGMDAPEDNPVTYGKSIFYDLLLSRAPRL